MEVSCRRARARPRALGLGSLGLGDGAQGLLDGLGLGGALGLLLLVIEAVALDAVVVEVIVGDVIIVDGEVDARGVRAAHLDPLGAQGVVEVGELVGVHVNVTDGNLDVVLGDARAALGAAHEVGDHLGQLVGELDLFLGLLGSSHVSPIDA